MKITKILNNINEYQNKIDFLINSKYNNERDKYNNKVKDAIFSQNFNVYNSFMVNSKYDNDIYDLEYKMLCSKIELIKEIQKAKRFENLLTIIFLRDIKHWSWNKIDTQLCYAEGTSKKKYYRYKKRDN